MRRGGMNRGATNCGATRRLGRRFYRQQPVDVAKQLLGQRLVHIVGGRRLAGTIVETEAYLGVEDKAAHSFGGRRTKRTETMYRDGGTSYVYLNYGIHHLFNVVVSNRDDPKAVLIRALSPMEGLSKMRDHRLAAKRDVDLCSGPGKLGQAMAFTREHNALDLVSNPFVFIERVHQRGGHGDSERIVACPRIGIDYAEEWAAAPLRFYLRGDANVSRSCPKNGEKHG